MYRCSPKKKKKNNFMVALFVRAKNQKELIYIIVASSLKEHEIAMKIKEPQLRTSSVGKSHKYNAE